MIPKIGQAFTIENLTEQKSFKNYVFICIAKNDTHVVGKPIFGGFIDNPVLLSPKEYDFFDASEIAEVLI